MTRIGIYPGTFDPVHAGHIAFARETAAQCGLDRVVLIPERRPRKEQVTDFADRVAMLQLATKDFPELEVAELSSERFTIKETLPELQKRFGHELTLLFGSDVVRTLKDWPDVDQLLQAVSLAIALRGQESEADINILLEQLTVPVRACLVPGDNRHATSTIARRDVHGSTDLDPRVKGYIKNNKLYDTAKVV
jgi:nicotinate-nucleotide adenylyltransferase